MANTSGKIHELYFMRLGDVVRRTGLSRATVYRLIAKRKFPRPYPLSEGRVGWSSQEIEGWIIERLQQSSDASS